MFLQMRDHKGMDASEAHEAAAIAFKIALPPLSTPNNIREYIGCIAVGITLGIFDGKVGSQLLYAAQVALGTFRAAKQSGRPKTTRPEGKEKENHGQRNAA